MIASASGGGGGVLTSTASTFSNYDSSKSAGYAEFPVEGEPKWFIIPYKSSQTGTPSYNFANVVMYNCYGTNEFRVRYRNTSRENAVSTSSSPSSYITYSNGKLSVKLFSGVRFSGQAGENILFYTT